MTTTTTTPAAAAITSSASAAQAAGTTGAQQLAGNFDTFLQLLTTQLQHQNPLDPIDTNQFTQQLVEFASVEQQVDMNTNLHTLISLQQTSEATSAMQFLGANVTIGGSTAALSNSTGTPANWNLSVPSPAAGTATITNSTGQIVYSGPVSLNAGNQTYTWTGHGNNGVVWPDGNYTLSIAATGANGQPVTVSTQVQGVVSAINVNANPPTVMVGGQSYPISAIQSINSSSLGSLASLNSLNTNIDSLNGAINNLIHLL
jgi:flagellar basal-body rod modification protein FlgD